MLIHEGAPFDRARLLARAALDRLRGADPDAVIEGFDHALALLLPAGASDALADVLRWKGAAYRDRGRFLSAAELFSQSLAVAGMVPYQSGQAHALNCLGTVAQARGELDAAESRYGEAARLAHRLGERRLMGMVQQNLGILADVQGRTDEATAHLRLALSAFERGGDDAALVWVLNNLAVVQMKDGGSARALDALDRARDLAVGLGDVVSEAIVEENRALVLAAHGRLDAADVAAARTYAIAEQRGDDVRRAGALRAMARTERQREPRSQEALAWLQSAAAIAEHTEDVLLRIEILTDLGDAYGDHDVARGRHCWRRALDLARLAGFDGVIPELQRRLHRGSGGGGGGAVTTEPSPPQITA